MQGGRVHLDCVRSALRAQGGRGIESRFCGAVGYRYQQNARTKRDVLLLPSQEKITRTGPSHLPTRPCVARADNMIAVRSPPPPPPPLSTATATTSTVDTVPMPSSTKAIILSFTGGRRVWFAAAAVIIVVIGGIVGAVVATRTRGGNVEASTGHMEEEPPRPLPELPPSYVSTYRVVARYPHSSTAFTQGLAFDAAGNLYESDGLYGQSEVRRVAVSSGASLASTANLPDEFGEGATVVGSTLVQLTWRENRVIEYALPDLSYIRSKFAVLGVEGWGLATNGSHLFVTDSTATLLIVEPGTYTVLARRTIIDPYLGGAEIRGVNELEFMPESGELWGNLYPLYEYGGGSPCIVRIEPESGKVLGWVDLSGLIDYNRPEVVASPDSHVLNGIAYHASYAPGVLVTGKKWDQMFHVEVVADAGGAARERVRSVCGRGKLWR